MKSLPLLSLALLCGCSSTALAVRAPVPRVAAAKVHGRCASVPLTFVAAMPVVEVTIGSRGPYRFGIDTGAEGEGRIKAELAETLGLPSRGVVNAPGPDGAPAKRALFGVARLSVGTVTFTGATLSAMPKLGGPFATLDGLFGIDLFRRVTVRLDYAGQRLAIDRKSVAGGAPIRRIDGAEAVPITIAGKTLEVHVDTGNTGPPLILPEADVKSLPLTGRQRSLGVGRTSSASAEMFEAELAAPVTLGGAELPLSTAAWPPLRAIGNLGSRAWRGRLVAIDQRHSRMEISIPTEGSATCGS